MKFLTLSPNQLRNEEYIQEINIPSKDADELAKQ